MPGRLIRDGGRRERISGDGTVLVSSACSRYGGDSPSVPLYKESNMSWDGLEADWKQINGPLRERWSKLTA